MNIERTIDIVHQIGMMDPQLIQAMSRDLGQLSDTMRNAEKARGVDDREFRACLKSAEHQSMRILAGLTLGAKTDARVH